MLGMNRKKASAFKREDELHPLALDLVSSKPSAFSFELSAF